MSPIRLRQVTPEDAYHIHQWKSDPVIRKMALDETYKSTIDAQRRDIETVLKSEHSRYDIIELDGNPVGYIRIDWMNDSRDHAWLRFAMGSHRQEGIMSWSLARYLSTLFANGCHRVEGEVYAFNKASIALLESLGFQREGIKRDAHRFEGCHHDVYVYGLLAEEYPSLAEGTRLELE